MLAGAAAAVERHPEENHAAQPAAQLRSLGQRRRGSDARSRQGAAERAVLEREQDASVGITAQDFHARERQQNRLKVGDVQLVHEKRHAVSARDRRRLRHPHLDERRQLRLRVGDARCRDREDREDETMNAVHQSIPTRPFTDAISLAES